MREISVDTTTFDRLLLAVASTATGPVDAAVEVENAAAAKYWAVLEFGSREGQRPWPRPGPRTVRGKSGHVFSRQAPQGYVFRHVKRFIDFLRDAYTKRAASLQRPLTEHELRAAALEAAERAKELIKAGVPVDTGALRDSIQAEKE